MMSELRLLVVVVVADDCPCGSNEVMMNRNDNRRQIMVIYK